MTKPVPTIQTPSTLRELYLMVDALRVRAKSSQSCHDCNGDSRELAVEEYAYKHVLDLIAPLLEPGTLTVRCHRCGEHTSVPDRHEIYCAQRVSGAEPPGLNE